MIVQKKEVKDKKEFLASDLLQGQAFVIRGEDIELKNVKIALCTYTDTDEDVVYLPINSASAYRTDWSAFRDNNYISEDAEVVPVVLEVEDVYLDRM
ncbi:hypothetical protein KIT04_006 [Vibrio phage KIT04]|nr:hypothetical protein KIT04_006 [Vibrio phage KIT04]